MLTIIAIDTSSDVASVALLRGEKLRSLSSEGFSTHSLSTLPMLQQLLKEEGIEIKDVDAIAFGCGPGSFTGLRTACGIAQGLSFGASIPVVPVVTLEAMAETCRRKYGTDTVLSLLDARMHEVYWGEYQYENGRWKTIVELSLSSAADVVPVGNPVFCGNGLTAYADDLMTVVGENPQYPDIIPHAEAIAILGKERFLRGETIRAADIEPLYLRNKVALKTAERLALKEKGE
ncbi:tRNA (adenosine(37)-N6)-threonylcarbamoyltransferase complex dimerization subunit type 1 TsaB [uncultured Oxalobacter sp.]|uniref:tRNA (adenosine(37)-N6)-threonylcarbamoyltransferase complex dimerization subunit type 1 TsaB n=1 Tax=uncultured Oxalobacter sp. TaxID=337245 RepID=UPI00259947FA|nr:tRNA (adenosine(37)-N6)-threonylcarbamoyltransferase complex dimerization subunit type 1 TsaB [uncultured Oxalobacter sp.]